MAIKEREYEEVFTISDVAKIFKLSVTTIRQLIRDGELPAIRIGRNYRIPKSAVDRYFAQPAATVFTPEEAGFGMWKDREDIGDSVDYVNKIRQEGEKSLRETIEELEEWEREQAF
ncbi:MAG: helix-turn-helix domain-containing protein [Anaerolineae bacterium]